MKNKCYVSAVIYVHNDEDKTLINFIERISKYLNSNFENYEVILVDDGNKKNIVKLIEENGSRFDGNITILSLAWKHKIETAMLAGMNAANGDYVFEFDSVIIDYPLQILMDLYEKSVTGYDIVSAVPRNKQRFTSKLFYKILNMFSYLDLFLETEYLRIISRRSLNRVLSFKQKVRYRKMLYSYTGLPSEKIYYSSSDSRRLNAMSFRDKLSLSIDILFSFSTIGTRIAQYFAVLFLFISLCIGLYVVVAYFYLDIISTGWPTTNGFIAISFCGVFIVLSILAKYFSMLLVSIFIASLE
jgi:glycosyltransferase involved in cell wall biosynthesis